MSQKELTINGIRWVHITKPNADDINYIATLHSFHPRIIEYIKVPTLHPLFEDYSDYFFFIAHFPIILPTEDPNEVAEIDFLITKNLLVTLTYRDYDHLNEIMKSIEDDAALQKRVARYATASLITFIIDQLFQRLMRDIDYLETVIVSIEDKIFKRRKQELLVEEISNTRRDVLDFRRIFLSQEFGFRMLAETAKNFYEKATHPYFNRLLVAYDKIKNFIENKRETIDVLYQTNESLATHHLNKIITVLTIASAIILPINLIASIWGMNYQTMPFVENPLGFWIIIGSMAFIAALLLFIFKKKNWL